MMYDKVTLLKQDNKQLGRKALRLVQLNLRFCTLLFLLLITVVLFVLVNRSLQAQPKHLSLHQYVRNLFSDPYLVSLKNQSSEEEASYVDEFDLIWSEETIELFQDQLLIILDDDSKTLKCGLGDDFIVTALPGATDDNLSDNLWQFFSLIALEASSEQYDSEHDSKKLSLKAFVTEQMRTILDQIFEGLSLPMLSHLPATCYDFKYAQIIGNKSPIKLGDMTHASAPLLLDPKAKRIKEIAQLFGSKVRPFFRLNRDVLKEVEQEFLVTKTIQEMEMNRDLDVNFVGLFIEADDKLPPEFYQSAMTFHRKTDRTIFVIICDAESLVFCQESFDGKDAVGDARILRKSVDTFDFALMASCNATIVSNDLGVLHALVNGGEATVFKPDATGEPEYYVPFLISELMANFIALN